MNYRENAKIFLLWGWILTGAGISNFIILRVLRSKEAYELMGSYSLGNWALFLLVGFIFMFILLRKMNRERKVYSHLDAYFNKLWQVTVAAFFVGTFICIRLGIIPPPIMLLIAGLATTVSGLFIRFKPLVIGGISFFLFSMAATFVNNEYIALLTSAAIVCGYLIPGYFLKSAKE
jgi:hypothetical protein